MRQAQAAVGEVLASGVGAFRHAAEAHERVASVHERVAAAGSGDVGAHERQAALHRAAAAVRLCRMAADTGDWHRAAELHAAQAFLDRIGQPWQALQARYRQASLEQIRAHLGQEQFERAYATGIALSPSQALDLVAGTDHPA